jgi:ubiquinone/menaquinone biosynthesis C-methylase UbiE
MNPYPILDETRTVLRHLLERELKKNDLLIDIGSCTRYLENYVIKCEAKYLAVDYPSWSKNYEKSLVKIDNKSPDLYSDIRNLGVKNGIADIVTCIDVLEHIDDTQKAIKNIVFISKSNGIIFILIPFLMEVHGGKSGEDDYYRFTKSSMEYLLRLNSCEVVVSEYVGKFGTTLNTLISGFVIREFQFSSCIFRKCIFVLVSVVVIPISLILRKLIDKIDTTHRNPSYILVVAKKL